MELRALGMLGPLVCMPILILAFLSFGASAAEDKVNIKDASVQENETRYCPEGWSLYQSDTQLSCLLLVQTPKKFRAAESHCHSLGGFLASLENQHKEEFVLMLFQDGLAGYYWTGLYKEEGHDAAFVWRRRNTTIPVDFDSLPSDIKSYVSYKEQCGPITSFSGTRDMDDCENAIYSVCEKEVSCKPGTFGPKCERVCHCLKEPCDQALAQGSEGVICRYGCQRKWMGNACDTEKHEPEIKYYCIKSADNSKYVYIRIYTKGLHYRSIYGLTSEKVRGEWCNSTITESHSSDLTTIRIPVNNISIEQMSSGECAGQVLDGSAFSWVIVLKEYEGVNHELDAEFNITCDFSVADSLVRSGKYTTGRQASPHQQKVVTKESIQDDVLLQLVHGYSGESVSEAVLGTPVVLEMKYALLQGSLLKGVRPRDCGAYTPDGEHVKQLLDDDGCQVPDSPVQSFNLKDGKIRTPWFNVFNFEGDTSVTFRCAFDLCFTSDCKVGCNPQSRQRRDTQDVTDEVSHSTTRTIRVLPSIPAKGDGQAEDYQPARPPAAPPGYDLGPFVYLNPVTCSLFLLILLVFLCMYIAFIRTLRKSVYDIRKEIEVRRSRDKFLHCGCVQQKDRDYVAP